MRAQKFQMFLSMFLHSLQMTLLISIDQSQKGQSLLSTEG
jgi:hypothetical protein